MNFVRSSNISLKYQRFALSCCKDLELENSNLRQRLNSFIYRLTVLYSKGYNKCDCNLELNNIYLIKLLSNTSFKCTIVNQTFKLIIHTFNIFLNIFFQFGNKSLMFFFCIKFWLLKHSKFFFLWLVTGDKLSIYFSFRGVYN